MVERRLGTFERETGPLLEYFEGRRKVEGEGRGAEVLVVEGETSDEIWPKLEREVRERFPGLRERRGHSLSEAVLAGGKTVGRGGVGAREGE